MPDPVRCPYCIEADNFKVMTGKGDRRWFHGSSAHPDATETSIPNGSARVCAGR